MIGLRHALRKLLDGRLRRTLAPFADADWKASAVIIAPHPDDETLGCGGIACKKIAAGAKLSFIFVTDGTASHRDSITPEALRDMREAEALEAVRRLGAPADRVTFLRFPDGQAKLHIEAIAAAIAQRLQALQPEAVFVPHAKDPPSDHAAVNAATLKALAAYGRRATVYEYPVWYWYHWPWVRLYGDLPGLWRMSARQTIRTAVGLSALSELNRHAYVGDVIARKRDALAAHASQMRRPEAARHWPTLADVGRGDFIGRLLTDYETFSCYEVNA
jgi:LmbE family N-acetylglucosaminyl deacetylase